jgi:hypothetical protein
MGGVYNVINLHTYHYAGNNPLKYTDPDGNADHYIIEINSGNVTFFNEEGQSFTSDGSNNTNILVSDTDRTNMKIALPSKSVISILAYSGTGKFTIGNAKDTEVVLDLGKTIDSYNDYLSALENKYMQLQKSANDDFDSALSSYGDFVKSYFSGVLLCGLGADPASIIGEGLAADGNPIESLKGIYDSLKSVRGAHIELQLTELAYNKKIWVNFE